MAPQVGLESSVKPIFNDMQLFFTHHRRLAELGLKAGAQMIELEPAAAATV